MSLFRFLSVSAFITSLTVAIKKLNVICLTQRFKTLENWNILVKRQRTIIIILLPCRKNLKISGWTSVTIDTCVISITQFVWIVVDGMSKQHCDDHLFIFTTSDSIRINTRWSVNHSNGRTKFSAKNIVIFRLKNNKKRLSHIRQDSEFLN